MQRKDGGGTGSGAPPGYRAATTKVASFSVASSPGAAEGGDLARTLFGVSGRAPWRMLNGVLSGAEPTAGRATYHVALTPKGKMVADLWALRLSGASLSGSAGAPGGAMAGRTSGGDPEELLLNVPAAAAAGLAAHLRKYVPPRFATISDLSAERDVLTLAGPEAARALQAAMPTAGAKNLGELASALERLDEGGWTAPFGAAARLAIVRTKQVWPSAFTLVGERAAVQAAATELRGAGVPEAGCEAWDTLRIEAGRPAYGIDMDDRTIPVEACIHERAIDYRKGCYTGQEVIVRIRDRGRVRRRLRLLRLGDAPTPRPGTPLAFPDTGKPAGHVTSATWSPRFEETIALAYVRAEADEVVIDERTVAV